MDSNRRSRLPRQTQNGPNIDSENRLIDLLEEDEEEENLIKLGDYTPSVRKE